MNYFVTAIGTDSGKTLVSAIITEMLGADYWKPVQAGYPRDTETVQSLVTRKNCRFHPEAYLLKTPASPHAAAAFDQVEIQLDQIRAPTVDTDLVVEGAGGILVPLNDRDVVLDLAEKTASAIILVSNFYLGSINHTLLTIEVIKNREIPVKGIIFNGEMNKESEEIILKKTGLRKLLHIMKEPNINQEVVSAYAKKLESCWD